MSCDTCCGSCTNYQLFMDTREQARQAEARNVEMQTEINRLQERMKLMRTALNKRESAMQFYMTRATELLTSATGSDSNKVSFIRDLLFVAFADAIREGADPDSWSSKPNEFSKWTYIYE